MWNIVLSILSYSRIQQRRVSVTSIAPSKARHHSWPPALITAYLISCLIVISGCGYHLGHGGGSHATSPLHVDVPMFRNTTTEPNLESLVTKEVKNALLTTPGITLVNDTRNADIVLRGQITRYRVSTTAFDQRAATEEDVQLSVLIRADDPVAGKTLWRELMKISAPFYLGPDITLNRSAQDRAIEEASASLAESIIDQLLGQHDNQRNRDGNEHVREQ